MTVRRARRDLYRVARVLGDVDAAKRGPSTLARRVVRKRVYAKSFGLLNRLLRGLR